MYICLTLMSPVAAKSIKIIMQRHDLTWWLRAPTRTVRHRHESLVSSGPDTKGKGHARWAAPGPCQFSPEIPPQVPHSSSQHNHYLLSITSISTDSILQRIYKSMKELCTHRVSHIWQTYLLAKGQCTMWPSHQTSLDVRHRCCCCLTGLRNTHTKIDTPYLL